MPRVGSSRISTVGLGQQPAGEHDLLLVPAAEGADRLLVSPAVGVSRTASRIAATACRSRGASSSRSGPPCVRAAARRARRCRRSRPQEQAFLAAVLGDERHAARSMRSARCAAVERRAPQQHLAALAGVEAEQDARQLGPARAHQAGEPQHLAACSCRLTSSATPGWLRPRTSSSTSRPGADARRREELLEAAAGHQRDEPRRRRTRHAARCACTARRAAPPRRRTAQHVLEHVGDVDERHPALAQPPSSSNSGRASRARSARWSARRGSAAARRGSGRARSRPVAPRPPTSRSTGVSGASVARPDRLQPTRAARAQRTAVEQWQPAPRGSRPRNRFSAMVRLGNRFSSW